MKRSRGLVDVVWRKSSYSGNNGGNCVEVGSGSPGVVPVRDSKRPQGPVLLAGRDAWSEFVAFAVRER
ncbi:DUF397 domain-containing protein [Streptomyces montanisoli]|uniref:DUF397 domain-containing protein n=1 Tax=Streptomyces montanisoli TaxID=2798581 RepID=A0A940MCC0_9ACTN|nr:DUF397 domain-containing protein [Streptomyces montanisoli]MBP0460365.1 DUF397 domain-containing protein [Streptomyces montanisoli]